MKSLKNGATTLLLTIALGSFALAQQAIDGSASSVKFTVTNLGIGVKGEFRAITGTVSFDPADLSQAVFDVQIPTRSVNTDNRMRDNHLREEDFFHVEKYPTITFKSEKVEKAEGGYSVTGTLTMRGVSKTVSIPFSVENNRFSGTFSLDRTDYGVGGDGFLNTVGEEVTIKIEVVTSTE